MATSTDGFLDVDESQDRGSSKQQRLWSGSDGVASIDRRRGSVAPTGMITKEVLSFKDGLTLKWFSIGDFVECQWSRIPLRAMLAYRIISCLVGFTGAVLLINYTVVGDEAYQGSMLLLTWEDWVAFVTTIYFFIVCGNTLIYSQDDPVQLEIENKPPETVVEEEKIEEACMRPCTDWCEAKCRRCVELETSHHQNIYLDNCLSKKLVWNMLTTTCSVYLAGLGADDDENNDTAMSQSTSTVVRESEMDTRRIELLACSLSMYRTPWKFQICWLFQNLAYANIPNFIIFWCFIDDRDPINPSRIVNQILIPLLMYAELALSRMVVRFIHLVYPMSFLGVYTTFITLYQPFKDIMYPHFLVAAGWKTIFSPMIFVLVYGIGVIPLTQLVLVGVVHIRTLVWTRFNQDLVNVAAQHRSLPPEMFLTLPGHLEPPRILRRSRVPSPTMTPIQSRSEIAEETV